MIEQRQRSIQTTTDKNGLRLVLLQFIHFVRVELEKLQIAKDQRPDEVEVIAGGRSVRIEVGHFQALVQEAGHCRIVQETGRGANGFVAHQVEHFAVIGWLQTDYDGK